MKKIFIIAVAALALTACEKNEDNQITSPVAAKISATIGETISRTTDNSWSKNDQIGISSTVGNKVGPYINVKYTTSGGDGKFTGSDLFFYRAMTLTAYYPFKGPEGTVPGTDGVIEANTRSENQDPAKLSEIDFLWDSKTGVDKKDFSASDSIVNFVFSHKMSKVSFKFQSSAAVVIDGITIAGPVNVSDMVSYTINGLVLDGTFNTATGVCAVKDAADAADLAIDVEDVKDNEAVRPVIIFPQTLNGGSAKLHIYTDELKHNDPTTYQHYNCNLTFSNGEIKPGFHYKYTIKVTKIGLIVGEMSVEPWEEEDRFMTATIDGEKVFDEKN